MTDFHGEQTKKKKKKKIQNGRFFKMAVFQNRQFSKFICENFIGLVGLIDPKGIDVALPIWL